MASALHGMGVCPILSLVPRFHVLGAVRVWWLVDPDAPLLWVFFSLLHSTASPRLRSCPLSVFSWIILEAFPQCSWLTLRSFSPYSSRSPLWPVDPSRHPTGPTLYPSLTACAVLSGSLMPLSTTTFYVSKCAQPGASLGQSLFIISMETAFFESL